MKLSLCMIVKNEAERLERCLQSAAPFVDETIILDTGSTDGTQEIAKRYATTFREIEWPDDFSAARNAGIDLASGDYIVILDADEWVPVRGAWRNLRDLLEKEKPDAVLFQVINHLPGQQILEGDYVWQVRVFRNTPEYRYAGRVHNQIASVIQSKTADVKMMRLPFRIEHDGYNLGTERLHQKFKERLHLVEDAIETATDDRVRNYYIFQKAKSLFMMKDFDAAYDTLECLDLDKLTDENAFDACILGVHTSSRKMEKKKANAFASHAMDVWPWEPMALFLKGVCLLGLSRFKQARTILLGALYYIDNPQMDYKYKVDRFYLMEGLADACFHSGRLGEAKQFYKEHLTKYPDNERVRMMEENIVPANGSNPLPRRVEKVGSGKTIQPLLQTD